MGSVRHRGASLGVLEGTAAGSLNGSRYKWQKGEEEGERVCVCVFVLKQAEKMPGDGIRGTGRGLEPG